MEKEYSELEVLFHQIMGNMKVKHFVVVILRTIECCFVCVMLIIVRIELSYTDGILTPRLWI